MYVYTYVYIHIHTHMLHTHTYIHTAQMSRDLSLLCKGSTYLAKSSAHFLRFELRHGLIHLLKLSENSLC